MYLLLCYNDVFVKWTSSDLYIIFVICDYKKNNKTINTERFTPPPKKKKKKKKIFTNLFYSQEICFAMQELTGNGNIIKPDSMY